MAIDALRRAVATPPVPSDAAGAERLALELLVGGYEGQTLPDSMARRLERGLTGVVLFARNFSKNDVGIDTEALLSHTAAIHAAAARQASTGGLPAVCAVDQEGGKVARLRAPFTHLPPMRSLAGRDDPSLTERVGWQTGRECLAAGFNVDFAPVLDIDTNPDNPIIADRAFGDTAEAVIRHAGAFLRGLQRAGVVGCGKHFPGHGDTQVDSHLALPVLDFDLERLEAVELRPFQALAGELDLVMTAHILFRALDPKLPATLSPEVLRPLLRGHCAFSGVVVSDDLEMRGVADAFSPGDCVRLGLRAGVDLFLICRDEARLEEAQCAAAKILRDGGEASASARAAIGRVRRLRSRLALPVADRDALRCVLGDGPALGLREALAVGTVL